MQCNKKFNDIGSPYRDGSHTSWKTWRNLRFLPGLPVAQVWLKNMLIWRLEVTRFERFVLKIDVWCGTQVHAISWWMMTTLLWTRPLWLSSHRTCLWSFFGIWWDELQWTVGFFKILQRTCSTKLFNDNKESHWIYSILISFGRVERRISQ